MKKATIRKALTVALCLVIAAAFTACGSSSSGSSSSGSSSSASSSDSSSSSLKGKTLTVVTEATFPPFDTTDDDGKVDGLDKDVVAAIAKDQGFKVKFKNIEFASLVPAVKSGSADIIAAGMTANPERKKQIDFTKTYYDSGLTVLVKKSNTTIKGEDSLTKKMKVASQTGTTGADEATKLEEDGKIQKAVILDGFDTCMLKLKNGDVDAVIVDKPVGENYMAKQPGQFKAVGKVLSAESFAFGVKKGNKELLTAMNNGLDDIVKSGEFKKICDKWQVESKFDK